MLRSEHELVFVGIWRENMFKSIELTFFRKIALVVFCVMLPGFVYGVLLLLCQDRPQFDVRSEVARVVFLQDVEGAANAVFLNRPGQFDECVRERGSELCLRLLSEKVAASLAGDFGAEPSASKASEDGASNADPRDDKRLTHLAYAYAIGSWIGLVIFMGGGLIALRVLRPNV